MAASPPPRPRRDPGHDAGDDEDIGLAQDRTLLAAERTYAAWMRTGLSIAAGGIAIVRLLPAPDRHSHVALAIGGAFVLLGIGIITYGARQFTLSARRLREGGHPEPTTPRAAWLISAGLAILLLAVLVFLGLNPPGGSRDGTPPPAAVTG
jgi:putative membrane protein